MRILYVEDDEFLRKLFVAQMGRRFHSVTTANNGADGIQSYHVGRFDAVVSDLMLGDMTGLDVYDGIRFKNKNEKTFLIATATPVLSLQMSALRKGIGLFEIKPINFDRLEFRLNDISHRINHDEFRFYATHRIMEAFMSSKDGDKMPDDVVKAINNLEDYYMTHAEADRSREHVTSEIDNTISLLKTG